MKQITLSEGEFKSLLDGVKHSAAIDDCRPMLQYIRIEVEKNKITAYTLDGYRASRFVINRKTENPDEFVCYIKPVPFKETKSGARQVLITHDEKSTTSVQYETEYGEIVYRFNTKGGELVNIQAIFEGAEAHDRETGINAKYLAQAMQALAKVDAGRNHIATIEGKSDILKPVLFKAKNSDYENTQLILPVRIPEGWNK
ncbi:MAG: hypothetical protein OSJ83_08020 [Clostridia bacterium]|nr:hypothetical protein [Clostridia bacterium]